MIRERHDATLTLLASSIQAANPTWVVKVNSTAEAFEGPTLKPDLQVFDNTLNQLYICDLAVTFEDDQLHQGKNAFQRTSAAKTEKYSPLSRHYVSQGYEVFLSALVYGALGSVFDDNRIILCQMFNMARSASNKLQCSISANHIKASRQIWDIIVVPKNRPQVGLGGAMSGDVGN